MESLQSLLEPHVHMSNAMPLVRVTNGKREATPRWQLRSSRASVVRMARVRIGMTTWYRRLKAECPDVKNGKVRSDVCDYCNQWDRSISRKIECSVVQIKLDLESVDALYFDGFNAPAAHEDISVAVLKHLLRGWRRGLPTSSVPAVCCVATDSSCIKRRRRRWIACVRSLML